MAHPSESFAIRRLDSGGTTLEQLRQAVSSAPSEAGVVLLRVGAVRFPPVCPDCGRPADHPLRIERSFGILFVDTGDSPSRTVYSDEFAIPFCDTCTQRQQSDRRPPPPWTPLLRVFSEAQGFAGVVVIAIGFMFVPSAIERLSIVPLLLACLPWLAGVSLIQATWKRSPHMSLTKPTETDLAVDFTSVISYAYEPAWRAFQFRVKSYADLFRQANADLVWNPRSSEAKSARAQRRKDRAKTNWIVGIIVLAVLLWGLWDEVLSEHIAPYFR